MDKARKPLSQYALDTLSYCARTPTVPSYESNPGVWRRLCADGLIEPVNGTPRITYRITEAGRAALRPDTEKR